ncbi:EpsG family protein [Kaistella yonginensis]|uniref:EpsG family protein n=1 Tax=Kaistella yonginensis TaxID=658267 RepID=UPI0025B34E43|nr:EpsG family protein [Kaistella yonginensis]MDN3605687.1 EpsG family protein [Kaistella yonginensis]
MILMLITLFRSYQFDFFEDSTIRFSRGIGIFLLLFVISYIGTRPISAVFQDMGVYAAAFKRIQRGDELVVQKDYIFNFFMIFSSKIMSPRWFFFLCALIYIIPCYLFSKKYGGSYWYYVFFIFVGSYMFWPFGTNGIRNGLGTSLFILALYFYERKFLMYAIMALSFGMHNSLIIPIAAFIVSAIYKNPKVYLFIWLAAIPLSLIGGGFWESFFGGLGFGDDTRAEDYLTKENTIKDAFAYTGFRWDFLFYSSFAAFAGWYFIFKKNITDKFYIHLWGVFMIANAFWILIIRANFSNRFAYLSWFLMAPVIAYPLLRYKLFPNQYRVVGVVIAIYYLFTYFMFLRG